ncbi:sugar nucleotide-binding protein [uncultured Senegalimassilia sp.]|uniref:sugar nucleotide-binding protein n=1 Tax=uncultured Senegalimassilia sp. TaxID=1714350 RepID=UPI00258B1FAF|nr:sugar nucleotide-binding protein [uncultured Senegalimassilia sp.]
MSFEFEKELIAERTNIPGMLVFDLSVHGDSRGWFKENWQRAKQTALGLPDLGPVQNNISFNAERGVTRGIHAEPWDKYISVATGSVFGAWVDLRPGKSFGEVYTCMIDPSKAIYVPRGVGNSFQALEDGTAYTYLVNAHWSAELKKTYTFVNLADSDLGIEWPIPLSECELSEADKKHPMLKDALPMVPRRTFVAGANSQLGRAVRALAEERGVVDYFDFTDCDEFDISNASDYFKIDWTLYGTVVNCAAYSDVDAAETEAGRKAAWAINAQGPALLAKVCSEHSIVLVHMSSSFVFDGIDKEHDETEPLSPLGVYGQTKAAGDIVVANCPKHYIVRSNWVIGNGENFVKTMVELSDRCADSEDCLNRVPVVDDQFGRLTFTRDVAEGIFWLLGYRDEDAEPSVPCEYGVYNLTGAGVAKSRAEIAAKIFNLRNGNSDAVTPVSSAEYCEIIERLVAARPIHSSLSLSKIENAGYLPSDWEIGLVEFVCNDLSV